MRMWLMWILLLPAIMVGQKLLPSPFPVGAGGGGGGGGGTAVAPYFTTVTTQTSVSISAATHNQGVLAVAYCFDNSTPRIAVSCDQNYTRDSSGNLVFTFSPAFTGLIEVGSGGGVNGSGAGNFTVASPTVVGDLIFATNTLGTAGGDSGIPSVSGVSAGTYGDSTHVGQFTVGAFGTITNASSVGITGTGGVGTPGTIGSFTGTTVTITAASHGQGAHPFPANVADSTGAAVSVSYHCKTSGGATVGCSDPTSNGDLVIGPVTSDTYTYQILGSSGGFANCMTGPGDLIYGGASGICTRLAANAAAGRLLLSGANAAPTWSTSGLTADGSGNLTTVGLTFTGKVLAPIANTSTAPEYSFTGATNMGIYAVAPGEIGIAVSGVEIIDIAGAGLVLDKNRTVGFTATNGAGSGADIAISRCATGILCVGTGAQGAKDGKIALSNATPTASSDACTAQALWADATYIYDCTASGVIKRIAWVTF